MITNLIHIIKQSGQKVLKIYQKDDFGVEYKSDNSPVTIADKISHLEISEYLKKNFPSIPIISEEQNDIPYEIRKNYTEYFLIDPVDGTKGFINQTDDFCINIAYLKNNELKIGVIYVPVTGETYYTEKGQGSFLLSADGIIKKLPLFNEKREFTAMVSRSHSSEFEKTICEEYGVKKVVRMSSAIKFCELAVGRADLYVRAKPTMEWDTGAGQLICEEVGFVMKTITGGEFLYNKESLVNTGFIVKK